MLHVLRRSPREPVPKQGYGVAVLCQDSEENNCGGPCSKAPPAGNPLLLQLVASLPQLPGGWPQLQYTAALVLSAYSEWLGATAAAGQLPAELIPRLLQMLTAGGTAALPVQACAYGLLVHSFIRSSVPCMLCFNPRPLQVP